MRRMSDCLFCRIVEGELSSTIVYEDEQVVAFRDVSPQAPTHVLVVPREHIESLAVAEVEHEALLGHLLRVGAKLAEQEGILAAGFRSVINTNRGAGQSVFHLHLHVLGGRPLSWPPG